MSHQEVSSMMGSPVPDLNHDETETEPVNAQSQQIYSDCWPQIQEMLDMLLRQTSSAQSPNFKPISYEQMYSAVYKAVCHQMGHRMHQDVLGFVSQVILLWRGEVSNLSEASPAQLLIKFNEILLHFLWAKCSIVPIFTYLDRFYSKPKLNTTLDSALLSLFRDQLVTPLIPPVMSALTQAESSPFLVTPEVKVNLLSNLTNLRGDYHAANPDLFAKYLGPTGPGSAPMRESDLEMQRQRERVFQEGLRRNMEGGSNQDRGMKRSLEDDG